MREYIIPYPLLITNKLAWFLGGLGFRFGSLSGDGMIVTALIFQSLDEPKKGILPKASTPLRGLRSLGVQGVGLGFLLLLLLSLSLSVSLPLCVCNCILTDCRSLFLQKTERVEEARTL